MDETPSFTLADRELSWLAFNERVLQEAADPNVPLFERIGFLAIFSSNLDEFFRVRVASLRTLLRLKKKKARKLSLHPRRLLRQIHAVVSSQQERFGRIFRDEVLPELAGNGVFLVDESSVAREHGPFLRAYFDERVRPLLRPRALGLGGPPIFLEDRRVYLIVEVWPDDDMGWDGRPTYQIVAVPHELGRFLALPESGDRREVMFLDDVIRFGLSRMFPDQDLGRAYAVKLSRDADLHLEDQFEDNVVDAIRKSLGKRKTGVPSRFLYDLNAPYGLVSFVKEELELEDDDLIPGGRYHNLHDLHGFPRFGLDHLSYAALPPLPHPALSGPAPISEVLEAGDQIVHFPYQGYEPVVRFLEEAAADPAVEEIYITVYRVAAQSAVLSALLAAAEAGKAVTVFLEVKARFDEAVNLQWGERLEAAGVTARYSLSDLKVHAKVALVVRREHGVLRNQAYLGTGNFNEKTSRIYADHGLFTADPRLADEVRTVFAYLTGEAPEPDFEHLLVAPFNMRHGFYARIDREIAHARAGRPAGMVLKMNSLEDPEIIQRLYRAHNAGVPIRLLVRGICRLIPGEPGQSENIVATSIVDRYLEHARVYLFRNGGQDEYLLASADWMHRNLSRRVEVAFPIYDPRVQTELGNILDLQLADTKKARVIDRDQSNARVPTGSGPGVRCQLATYRFLEQRAGANPDVDTSLISGEGTA